MATETARRGTEVTPHARPIGRRYDPDPRTLTVWQRVAYALGGGFARVLFALPFLVFGASHFIRGEEMAAMVPDWLPAPTVWVYLVGVALIAAGVALVVNRAAEVAGVLLAVMLGTFIGTIHIPALIENPDNQTATIALLKDFGLMAGALLAARAAIGLAPERSTEPRRTP